VAVELCQHGHHRSSLRRQTMVALVKERSNIAPGQARSSIGMRHAACGMGKGYLKRFWRCTLALRRYRDSLHL
jgi:hypothetical protein